jgi:predicted ribosome quality control (RQC) complex YloA/Tae2 family protein
VAPSLPTSPSTPGADGAARGLSADELAAVLGELRPTLADAEVLDVLLVKDRDDVVLVVATAAGKAFLHCAPGGARARICTTSRRWRRDDLVTGPKIDLLRAELQSARLDAIEHEAGERRCTFRFRTPRGARRLAVELFSARGLWALLDEHGRIRAISRPVATAVRTLRTGDPYVPPPVHAAAMLEPRAAPPPRFQSPVAPAVDAHFTALDLAAEAATAAEELRRLVARALAKATARATGLETQLRDGQRVAAMRGEADLMLAYAHTVPRGAATMVVPDPNRDDAELRIELDPAKPVTVQARERYERARRLEDAIEVSEARLAKARTEQARLQQLAALLSPSTLPDGVAEAVRSGLQQLGLLPKPKAAAAAPPAKKLPRCLRDHDFRQFVSAEGYPILVGRTNEQNDALTMRVAAGNDLWLHVGGGRAGSHVVVRLPKGKTASLETLLDAGTLAVHFSKARGERRIDVIYTFRKHVRKPKGLPAGAVVPAQTKTLSVQLDEARLQRLLGSGPDSE